MKNQLNEGELLVNRVKLLMGYNMSKTLNENSQYIFEQPDSKFDTPGNKEMQRKAEQEILNQRHIKQAEEEAKQYPNWCRYPDKTVQYPKNPDGAEGEDSIIYDEDTGLRMCYYLAGKNYGVPIPENSKIDFWNIQGISDFVDQLIKKYPEKYKNFEKEILISNLSSTLPPDSVRGFYVGSLYFTSYITRKQNGSNWTFGGFRDSKTKKPYEEPKWKDPRSEYGKFIDKFGIWIQLGVAALTLFAGFFTMGTTWGVSTTLLIEIALEIGVAVPIGMREFQKGKNVSGVFSFIFGALPFLKLTKYFRGVSDEVFESLSIRLADSGLSESSKVSDFVKFYNKLSPEEQKLMSQMLDQDNYTRAEMLNKIKIGIPKQLELSIKNMAKVIKNRPGMLYDLKFYDKIWALDLMRNVDAIVGMLTLEILLGDKLNDEEKNKLESIYIHIPDSLKKELTYNLVNNPDIISDFTRSPLIDSKIKSTSKGFDKLMNTNFKTVFKKNNKKYVELPTDSTTGDDVKFLELNSKDVDTYRKNGYIPSDELSIDDTYDSFTLINNVMWVKVKKLNNGETNPIVTDTIK